MWVPIQLILLNIYIFIHRTIVKPSFLIFFHSFLGLAQIAFKQRWDRNAVERGQPTVTITSVDYNTNDNVSLSISIIYPYSLAYQIIKWA